MTHFLFPPKYRAYRRLFYALLLSLLVHLWLVGGLGLELPDLEHDDDLMVVELAPPPSIKPAAPASAPKPAPVPKHPVEPRRPILPPPPAPDVPVAMTSDAPEPPAPAAKPTPEPESAMAQPPSVADAQAGVEPVGLGEEIKPQAPKHVEIDYQIVRKGGMAGVERHRYQATEDGQYTLSSVAEPKGLLALVLSDLVQNSEGRVTERGLRPSSYVYQYGKKPDKAQKAGFAWSDGVLVLESGGRRQTVELQEGTQDLMSFMYQFMFIPPLQEMHLAVTNGKKLKVYNYGFEGEETLEMKMGPLRTWHIGKSSSDGEEKTEIWLAADYHYLPVKIRKTEKDGTVTERIATRLQIE